MNQSISATPADSVDGAFRPLEVRIPHWQRWLSGGLSAAMLAVVLYQIDIEGLVRLRALAPATPLFWATFLLLYLALPLSELMIFRRLWRLPLSGFGVLLRKRISNEILLGYSGEVYFYAWARGRAGLSASPFGAVKDVGILSALVGNLVTLAMMALAWPMVRHLDLGRYSGPVAGSAAIIIALSILMLAAGGRLFSLSRPELRFVFLVHLARILVMTFASALLWHLALGTVALGYWLMLATLQLLVSRLPLVPNKDLVFATLTAFLIGHDSEVSALMAMIATLTLATHLLAGGLLVLTGMADDRAAGQPGA